MSQLPILQARLSFRLRHATVPSGWKVTREQHNRERDPDLLRWCEMSPGFLDNENDAGTNTYCNVERLAIRGTRRTTRQLFQLLWCAVPSSIDMGPGGMRLLGRGPVLTSMILAHVSAGPDYDLSWNAGDRWQRDLTSTGTRVTLLCGQHSWSWQQYVPVLTAFVPQLHVDLCVAAGTGVNTLTAAPVKLTPPDEQLAKPSSDRSPLASPTVFYREHTAHPVQIQIL